MSLILSIILSFLLVAIPVASSEQPKNLIIFIGDGMGPQQLGLLFLANEHRELSGLKDGSALVQLMQRGSLSFVQPIPFGGLVMDSACASTQIATGSQALPQTLGIDQSGEPGLSILELAKRMGKSTGLVSDTRITHATPAGFYATAAHRDDENLIAEQLIRSSVDIALSGGAQHFIPQGIESEKRLPFTIKSKREDGRDLLTEASSAGYTVVGSSQELAQTRSSKILGLFASSGMTDAISENRHKTSQPSLVEMTRQALRLLERNPNGFFLMVEAGQIDWAGHANDAGWLLHEMYRADQAIAEILKWQSGRNDTLLVATADHETGGFGFSYHAANIPTPRPFPGTHFSKTQFAPTYNFVDPTILKLLYQQKESILTFVKRWRNLSAERKGPTELQSALKEITGLSISEQAAIRILKTAPNRFYNKNSPDLNAREWTALCSHDAFYPKEDNRMVAAIARELAEKTGIVWASGNHTSTPVPAIWYGTRKIEIEGYLTMDALGRKLQEVFIGSQAESK